MHITLVHVHVKPEHLAPFLEITRENCRGARAEPGNVRFDVIQSEDDPSRFVLIEAYRDAEAAAAHKTTPHYQAWRDRVADWMASPREGKRYHAVDVAGVPRG